MASASLDRDARELADVIAANQQAIERRWLELVQADIVKAQRVELTQLRDGLPHYLSALVRLLRSGRVEDLTPLSSEAWSTVAREHGVTRVRLGFDIAQLVHEFVVLRHVIQDEAHKHGLGVHSVLADVIDAAIAAAVRAYVDARDYDARRRQAEHIGFLTHELRSPLSTAVLGTAELRRLASDDQLRHLERLERSHQKLLELVDSVLLTQRLEAGKIDVDPISVTIGEIVGPVLEGARPAAASKRLEVRTAFDPNVVIRCDPELTRSALQNLIDNAVKYTDHGHVELGLETNENKLVIHVRDTCPGLSNEELRTIFEPFERGHAAARRSGTGLGLAIARRAIEAQGGSVEAESPGASGCHFWITLPTGNP